MRPRLSHALSWLVFAHLSLLWSENLRADLSRREPTPTLDSQNNCRETFASFARPPEADSVRFHARLARAGSGYAVWNLDVLQEEFCAKISRGGEIRLRSRGEGAIRRVSLRMKDADGEFLQFIGKDQGGSSLVHAWSFTEKHLSPTTWGARTNGRLDFPLRTLQLTIDAKGGADEAFDLILESLEYADPEDVARLEKDRRALERERADWIARTGLRFSGIPAFAVFTPEERPVWRLAFDKVPEALWSWSFIDESGRTSPSRPVSVEGGSLEVPLPVHRFGPVALRLEAREGDEIRFRTNLAYSVVHPITWKWKAGDALLGICSHIEGRLDRWSSLKTNAGEDIARLYRKLGVSHDRGELVSWQGNEPEEGRYDWTRKDRVMAYLKTLDVRAFHVYAYTPKWASTGDTASSNPAAWNRSAPRVEPFVRWCGDVAERYKDQIDGHEIWNEANWSFWRSTVPEYVRLALAARERLALVDPGSWIVPAGHAQGQWGKVEEIVKGTSSAFSQMAFHLHGTREEGMDVWENRYEPLFRRYGLSNDRLIDTETGYSTVSGGNAITNQALILQKKLIDQLSRGIRGVMWYDLLSDGPDPLEGEHHYGIVSWDRTVKPAFAAYNRLIRDLGGAKPVTPTSFTGPVALAEFQKGDDRIVILWNQKNAMERPVRIAGFPGVAELSDLYGNSLGDVRAGEAFSVDDRPRWLRIPGFSGRIASADGRLRAEGLLAAPKGEWVPLTLRWSEELSDASLEPRSSEVDFDPPRILLSSTDRGADFRIRLKDGVDAGDGRISLMRRNSELESLSFRLRHASRIPGWQAGPITGGPEDSGRLEPVLAKVDRDSVKELLTFVGSGLNELWQGPDDLSGKLFLAHDADHLVVHLEVRDADAIWPEGNPEDMWKADSIQVAIDNLHGGLFELGLTMREGKSLLHVWRKPSGSKFDETTIRHAATRKGGSTFYTLALPLSALDRKPGDALTLGALVNDADRKLRKQFLEFGGGIGFSKDPSKYLPFVLGARP